MSDFGYGSSFETQNPVTVLKAKTPVDPRSVCTTTDEITNAKSEAGVELRYPGLITFETETQKVKVFQNDISVVKEMATTDMLGTAKNCFLAGSETITYTAVEATTNFTVPQLGSKDCLAVIYNNLVLIEGVNYSISGTTITLGFSLPANEVIYVVVGENSYSYNDLADKPVLSDGSVNLDNYYSKSEVDSLINGIDSSDIDLSGYYTKSEVDSKISTLNSTISALATRVTALESSGSGSGSGTTTISVTGVTLNKSTASVTVGSTVQLTATVAPTTATNRAVTWSSSDTSKATVSTSGLVKGIAAGSATITVKTSDGNKTATCTVTVTAATSSTYNSNENVYLYNIANSNTEIPLNNGGITDTVTTNWGDGTTNTEASHTYSKAGNYTVVTRYLPRTVGATDVTNASTTSLKKVVHIDETRTDLNNVFRTCTALEECCEIGSNITSMVNTFSGCTALATCPTISNAVTTLQGTFSNCTALTAMLDLSKFTKCTDMKSMYAKCTSLKFTSNYTIPSSVTATAAMFMTCTALTAPITVPATVSDSTNMYSGCTALTITHATAVDVTGSSTKLAVGSSLVLTAAITPSSTTYKNIIWTSSDTTIATVTAQASTLKANVVGVKAGSVTIKATSAGRSTIYGEYTITIS